MRVKNTMKSTATGMINYIVAMLLGFVSRAILVRALGNECVGLNGLFSNILSMLSIVETGMGTAILLIYIKRLLMIIKRRLSLC